MHAGTNVEQGHPVGSDEPEWGATREHCDADSPAVGPAFDCVAEIEHHLTVITELLTSNQVPIADLPDLAVRLHTAGTRVQAAHFATVEQVKSSAALPPGPVTTTAWLRHSHRLTGSRASHWTRTAAWLGNHSLTADAFAAGSLTLAHVNVMRAVSEANDQRRAAFLVDEATFVELAAAVDSADLRRVLQVWAENIDPETSNDDADEAYAKRRLFLSQVGDGWELDGHLPDVLGAELAGILNELMEKALRDAPADRPHESASARRADALLDAARAAARSELTDAARIRAATAVTLPVHRLHTCPSCGGHHHGPQDSCDGPGCALWQGGRAASHSEPGASEAPAPGLSSELLGIFWAVSNGPGGGYLAPCEAQWLTCDGEITRLILDPESRPLDIGRSTRVVPTYLRRALDVRDRGCVIPDCDRPTGWCEAHHVTHWAHGGTTGLQNLALLCSKHHHELHLGHWQITMTDGLPHVAHVPPEHHRQTRIDYQHRRQPQAA